MEEFSEVRVLKALGDTSRVRAMLALQHNELCVCQIVELLGLAPSTVSKHLQILRDAGLVRSRKIGRWVYYRSAERGICPMVDAAIDLVTRSLNGSTEIERDRRKLKQILKKDPEELCRIQNGR